MPHLHEPVAALVDLLHSDGGPGLLFGRRRPDLENAVGMLKLLVSMAQSATRALHIQAFVLLTLALTLPRAVANSWRFLDGKNQRYDQDCQYSVHSYPSLASGCLNFMAWALPAL